ncbi:MAG TPA: class I SAM-dependent methyltransferase family protein [Thermoplasmatales archaeon]|nr:class I SAM-dependent methyltransferase family protein [Thermoplasmatales archaeon]
MIKTPYELIRERLQGKLPSHLLNFVPGKWEKIGNVLILKIPEEIRRYREEVAEVYAKVLSCKSVLEDAGGVEGEWRKPRVRFVYGDSDTETLHVENGIRYRLDPAKIMFSSGNMDERIRMARIAEEDETVVDMFAGIGYFSLPVAVYSKPKRVYAVEINPVAHRYLCENISLNNVNDVVEPVLGDNRKVTPKDVADRVIMGYLHDTHRFLPAAFSALRDSGVLHYHEVCPNELLSRRPLKRVEEAAKKHGFKVDDVSRRVIKSYAPGVSHVVLDVWVRRV